MSLLRCSHSAQKHLYYLFYLTKSTILFKSISGTFSASDEILYSLTWGSVYILSAQEDTLLEKDHTMYFFHILLLPCIIMADLD